jgi:hypothetical protein
MARLFVTLGERGQMETSAQDLATHYGKVDPHPHRWHAPA